jgi:hypothetical protein
MQTFYQLLGLVAAGLLVWTIYRTIKGKPEQFSRENLAKSFSSLGMLALGLIAFVALLVLVVKNIS